MLNLNLLIIFSLSASAEDSAVDQSGNQRREARSAYLASVQANVNPITTQQINDVISNPTYLSNGAQDNASMRAKIRGIITTNDPQAQEHLDQSTANSLRSYIGAVGRPIAASEIPNFDANGNYSLPGFGPQPPLTQKQMDLYNAARKSGHAPTNAADYLEMLNIRKMVDIGNSGSTLSNGGKSDGKTTGKAPAPTAVDNSSNVDYITGTKDSSVNMLAEATKKYKSGKLTKDQFINIALQVGQTVDYANQTTGQNPSETIIAANPNPTPIPTPATGTTTDNKLSNADRISRRESIKDIYSAYGQTIDAYKLEVLTNNSASLNDIKNDIRKATPVVAINTVSTTAPSPITTTEQWNYAFETLNNIPHNYKLSPGPYKEYLQLLYNNKPHMFKLP